MWRWCANRTVCVGCFPPVIFGVIFLTICSSMTTEAVLGMAPPSQIPLCKAAADSSSLPSHKRGATEAMLEPESAEFPLLLHKRPNVAGPSCITHDDAVPWPASPGEQQQPLPWKKGSGAAQHRAKGAFNSRAGGSSFDERMHPRNRYFRHRPDFAALAAQFGDFAALTTTDSKGRVHVDWKDAAASAALTRALLCADYGLQWELPRGFLCPPVPQRANYIHWIEDLLAGPIETAVKPASAVSIPAVATGLDIGVGASGIYPLLALSLHPAWKMIGTEINPEALASARANVERNGLCPKIDLRLVSTDGGVLVDAINDQDGVIDFCMCNPPFFAAEDDAHKASHYRASEANLLELVTPGGERAFVHRIIADSKTLQGRVRWYTTMVGHKSSVAACVAEIKRCAASQVRTTTFYQGKTIRWGVAWSYVEQEPRVMSLRFSSPLSPHQLMNKLDVAAETYGGFSLCWLPQLVVSTDLHPHAQSELVSGASGDLGQQNEEIEAHANELGTLVDASSPAHTKSRDVQVDEILRLTGSSHIEAVSYKAAGRGQVFRESWSRRARRSKVLQNEGIEGPGNISQPSQPLFDFAVLLQRLGLPATLPVQEVQKVREDRGGGCITGGDSVGDGGVGRIAVWDGGTDSGCSEGGQEAGEEWLATIMLDRDSEKYIERDRDCGRGGRGGGRKSTRLFVLLHLKQGACLIRLLLCC